MRTSVLSLCVVLILASVTASQPRDGPMEQVEKEHDYGAGRIVDRPTYELDRMERSQDWPSRELELLLEEQDRRRLEQKQRPLERSRTPTGVKTVQPPPPGIRLHEPPVDSARIALAADILAALDEQEQLLRQAQIDLTDQPTQLKARQQQIRDAFARDLLIVLQRYDVKRAPTTQPQE